MSCRRYEQLALGEEIARRSAARNRRGAGGAQLTIEGGELDHWDVVGELEARKSRRRIRRHAPARPSEGAQAEILPGQLALEHANF
jgi:hypothetical protein